MTETIRIPLLHDHHTHPLLYASFSQCVSLLSVESKSAANDLILAASQRSDSPITVAHGWRSNQFAWTPAELEALPPVAIFNVSLHELKMNEAGKFVIKDRYGEQVENVADQDWYEDHFRMILNWFANLYASADALTHFYDQLMQLGIYSAEEMLLIDENEIKLFDQAGLSDRTRFWSAPDTYETLSDHAKQQVYGLKLFTDGALGAHTAALNRPFIGGDFSGGSSNRGKLMYSDVALEKTIEGCLATGKALSVHAIGDRAIEQLMNTLENQSTRLREVSEVRIEHAQMIERSVAERAKHMGIVLSMQPNFSSDSVDYRDRVDASYCELNNPFRMLIDEVGFVAGEDLVFGSDGMPHGIEFAIEKSLFPSIDSQRLTIDEFQAGYCLSSFDKGYLEVKIDENRVLATRVFPAVM